jgi:hypothetical protein
MVAEMSEACLASQAQTDRIKRLEAQLKESEDNRARVELACQEKIRSHQEFMDRCLASQLDAEQRASSATDEVKRLQDLLSSTQEAMLQAEQKAEEARLGYERQDRRSEEPSADC